MTEFPSDQAGERAIGDEPAAGFEFTGFDAALAAAMKDVGEQVGPDEFDARAILRRTARRRTSQVLGTAAAGIAVVAGATVFAAHIGPVAAGKAAATATASHTAAPEGTDPLTLPGSFRTAPSGSTPIGYSVYGASANLTEYPGPGGGGNATMLIHDAQAGSTSAGAEYQVSVGWEAGYYPKVTDLPHESQNAYTPVGTVNGHPAYYSAQLRTLAFWAGSAQGYAREGVFVVTPALIAVSDPAVLMYGARAYDTASAAAPLPLRITGLDSAKAISASFGQASPGASSPNPGPAFPSGSSWYVNIGLQIDGRTYEITANPGPAVTPPLSSLARLTGGTLVSATKTVDGLGIMVSTPSGKSGSASAPTVSQVLAHVTSLGTDPSGWTTDVIVK